MPAAGRPTRPAGSAAVHWNLSRRGCPSAPLRTIRKQGRSYPVDSLVARSLTRPTLGALSAARSVVSPDASDRGTADGTGRRTCAGIARSTADDGALRGSADRILTRRRPLPRGMDPIAHQGPADGARSSASTGITGDATDHRALGCATQRITRLRGKRTAKGHHSECSSDHQLLHLDISHVVAKVLSLYCLSSRSPIRKSTHFLRVVAANRMAIVRAHVAAVTVDPSADAAPVAGRRFRHAHESGNAQVTLLVRMSGRRGVPGGVLLTTSSTRSALTRGLLMK